MMDDDNPYNDDYPMDDGVEVGWSGSYDKDPNNDTDDDDTDRWRRYMLVKVLHDPNGQIRVSTLPTSVLPVEPAKFYHNSGPSKKAKVEQFPVTVAYAITNYKCQGRLSPTLSSI
jgi:hypothetical protein